MSKLVAITIDGETQIHAANTTGLNYASLCGLDGGREMAIPAPVNAPLGYRKARRSTVRCASSCGRRGGPSDRKILYVGHATDDALGA